MPKKIKIAPVDEPEQIIEDTPQKEIEDNEVSEVVEEQPKEEEVEEEVKEEAKEEPIEEVALEAKPQKKEVTQEAKPQKKEVVRITKLVECPNCKKHMTAKSLRYTHEHVCPGGALKQLEVKRRIQKVKEVVREQPITEVRSEAQPSYSIRDIRLQRLKEQKDRYRHLFSNAI